jgi:hypothetical protein
MSEEQVTMEGLTKEQKQLVEKNIANFQKLWLDSFVTTQQGPIQKMPMPKIMLGGQLDDQVQYHQHEEPQQYQLREQPLQYMDEEPYQLYRLEELQRHEYGGEQYHQRNNGWAGRIAKLVEEQFGLKSKEQTCVYRQPYPQWFDRLPLLHRYKIPEFSKYSG